MKKIGKYQILEKIGKGGFGDVYKGLDPFIKRNVAVKTCNTDEKEVRDRFFQEAEIAGNLHHRNVTTVYDFGVDEGVPFLIQEYLSGEDLDAKVKRREVIPYAEKLHYLLQIARGLAYAHEQGVIHRDIKPANVRILEDGTAKIMDFGIAKLAQQESGLTQTGMTLGTAAYLAPEQIKGEPVTHATDVFSFGVLAYELLTYHRPFEGEQISNVLYQILNQEPRAIVELWPPAPADVRDLVKRCLQKDPRQRFADGNALRLALEQIQAQGKSARAEEPNPMVLPQNQPPGSVTHILARDRPASGAVVAEEPTRTLDSIELSSSSSQIDLEQRPTLPMHSPAHASSATTPMRTQKKSKAVPILLTVLACIGALGAGWYLGRPQADAPATTANAVPAEDAATSMPTEDIPPAAAEPEPQPVVEEPEEEAAAPPPPPPGPGVVRVPAVVWTDGMTVRIDDGNPQHLLKGREFELDPGTYTATFFVDDRGYVVERTARFEIRSDDRTTLQIPIPRPGAVSVRARPGRPQGEIILNGLDGPIDLGQSPVRSRRLAPGTYQVEIASSSGARLNGQVVVQSGEEKVLTFDLDDSTLRETAKDLE